MKPRELAEKICATIEERCGQTLDGPLRDEFVENCRMEIKRTGIHKLPWEAIEHYLVESIYFVIMERMDKIARQN